MKKSAFLQSEGFKKYFANTSWMLLERVISLGSAFFLGIYIANYLDDSAFGLFNYSRSFAGIITVVASLGIDTILVRNILNDPAGRDRILGTAFTVKLLGGFISLGIIAIANQFADHDTLTKYMVLIIGSSVLFESFNVLNGYFQSQVMSKYVVYVEITKTILSAIIRFLLVQFKMPLIYFAVVVSLEMMISAIGWVYFYSIKFDFITRWKFSWPYAKEVLRDSLPLVFNNFVVLIYMRIDQIMIKHLLDNKAVGHFAAALRLSEVSFMIPSVIVGSLFPAIINAKKTSQDLYNTRVQNLYDLLVCISLCIAIPTTLLASFAVDLLFKESFHPAAGVLVIHIWSNVFVGLGVASGSWLLAENLQKISIYRTALGAVINVILNFILIPAYGINGAAIATVVSQAVASYFGYLISPKTWIVFWMQTRALLLLNVFTHIKNFTSSEKNT